MEASLLAFKVVGEGLNLILELLVLFFRKLLVSEQSRDLVLKVSIVGWEGGKEGRGGREGGREVTNLAVVASQNLCMSTTYFMDTEEGGGKLKGKIPVIINRRPTHFRT